MERTDAELEMDEILSPLDSTQDIMWAAGVDTPFNQQMMALLDLNRMQVKLLEKIAEGIEELKDSQ